MLSCLAAAFAAMPCMMYAMPAGAEPETESAVTESASADDSEEVTWEDRTEAEVFAKMKLAAENDRFELWAWDDSKLGEDEKPEDILALKNKKTGYVWWSSPINAGGDSIAAPVLRSELGSALVVTAAQINERSTTNARSGDTNKTGITFSDCANGIRVTYNFRKLGIKVPVQYTLGEDYLEVRIDTSDISEKNDAAAESPVLAHTLSVCNAFGAADMDEEGYFVIPDGSGAVINFNNQKYTAKTYSQLIYDVDTTAVPKTKGPVVEGVSLPMYGIVKGENAMLAVAAEGDGSCYLCADVSGTGQSNTEYNRAYFKFMVRSVDQYYLGSDQLNPLDVYEKNLSHRQLAVRYYPLSAEDAVNADGSDELDYVDIAARYRQYLMEEKGVQKSAQAKSAPMYLDLYGGCMKQRNVLGFPVFMKTAMTSYSEMQQILLQLKAASVNELVVALNNWTAAGISGKVDYKAKASATLGGNAAFKDLRDYLDQNSIAWYPVVNNTAYYSGQGYHSLTDTAVRVSGSFARIVDYENAYGVPYGDKKTMSLLSPAAFPELMQKLTQNYSKAGFEGVCIGDLSSKLYGDYGKKSGTARDTTMQYIQEGLAGLKADVGSVLSKDPNAYVLPYTDRAADIPLYSSGFNIFDGDIPLYQLVLHGVIPYATKAVNGSADAERLVLKAVAAGSNLRFDMLQADISDLKDTDFDIYFYAQADNWTENAAQYYRFAKDILSEVSDSYIISYETDGDTIKTTYANGCETLVDLEACSVSLNGGQPRFLRDYVKEGAEIFQ